MFSGYRMSKIKIVQARQKRFLLTILYIRSISLGNCKTQLLALMCAREGLIDEVT